MRKRGLLPQDWGDEDEEPVWPWEEPVWPAEMAAATPWPWEEPFLQKAAIRQGKTVTFLYCGSLKFTSEIKKTISVAQSSNPKKEE